MSKDQSARVRISLPSAIYAITTKPAPFSRNAADPLFSYTNPTLAVFTSPVHANLKYAWPLPNYSPPPVTMDAFCAICSRVRRFHDFYFLSCKASQIWSWWQWQGWCMWRKMGVRLRHGGYLGWRSRTILSFVPFPVRFMSRFILWIQTILMLCSARHQADQDKFGLLQHKASEPVNGGYILKNVKWRGTLWLRLMVLRSAIIWLLERVEAIVIVSLTALADSTETCTHVLKAQESARSG